MKARCVLLALLAAAGLAAQPADVARDLDEVARIASVMVDGDACRRIVTPRALEYLLKEDPRDRWLGSDNYDVNHQPFIQVKKTLMRLARLVKTPCDLNLWMPLAAKPPRVMVVIRNVQELSQFWSFGVMHQPMPPEMEKVLATGERLAVRKQPGLLSVLAPVYDSLDDIVGLVEAVARERAK